MEQLQRAETRATLCREYRERVERELKIVCRDAITVVERRLIPKLNASLSTAVPGILQEVQEHRDRPVAKIEEALAQQLQRLQEKTGVLSKIEHGDHLVFYYKMIADYHRYLAEFNVESEAARLQESVYSLGSYYLATEIARTHLTPTSPCRLALALNFCVFYYEIMAQPARACQLAKHAFDDATSELIHLDPESVQAKDCKLIMGALKANLEKWTHEHA